MAKKFKNGLWQQEISTRDFILQNMTPYEGDASFLVGPAETTKKLWKKASELLNEELSKGGILDIDTETISTITSHKPGYLDKKLEKIVGIKPINH
jgi:formate C-acetyltransferase